SDTLPANTTYVGGSLTSSQGTVDDSGAPVLSVDIGTMNDTDTVTITFRVTVDAGTPAGTVISNQGSVDSDQTVPEPTDADGEDANGDQPTDIPVGGQPDLNNPLYAEKRVELWLDDGNGVVNPNDTLRYTLVLNNRGSETLTGVSLTDTIPAGLSYVAASALASLGTVNVTAPALSWTIASLPAGGFATLVFDVTVVDPLYDGS
ncbi:MAG: DUF11 domain-containing protein, partial [Candidatus Competibacteraceae bacterium]|nr:DUF11 domain-containing protein [Candidatus Competibacteraceae bacterium]